MKKNAKGRGRKGVQVCWEMYEALPAEEHPSDWENPKNQPQNHGGLRGLLVIEPLLVSRTVYVLLQKWD